MATFETVATFNDKKNGNSNKVSVNIAMLPLKKKMMKKTNYFSFGCWITNYQEREPFGSNSRHYRSSSRTHNDYHSRGPTEAATASTAGTSTR